MRSRRIPAKQAHGMGIRLNLLADDKLEAATGALVDELTARITRPSAQRTAKKLLIRQRGCYVWQAIEL